MRSLEAVTSDLRLHNAAVRREQREALAKARAFCEGLALRRPDDVTLRRVLAEVVDGDAVPARREHAHRGLADARRPAGHEGGGSAQAGTSWSVTVPKNGMHRMRRFLVSDNR